MLQKLLVQTYHFLSGKEKEPLPDKEKEYLVKLDNQKEVEKLLEQYILRFERNPKEEPELSHFHLFDAKRNVKGVHNNKV